MKDQRGFSLIEVVISVALLGIIAAAFFSALGTGSKVLFVTDERETAKNLAESQMEYVKLLTFEPGAISYPHAPIGTEYAGYSVDIAVDSIPSRDSDIQKITVIIEHNEEEITRLEGYKTIR